MKGTALNLKIYAEISIKLYIYITKIVFKILQLGLFKDRVRKFKVSVILKREIMP